MGLLALPRLILVEGIPSSGKTTVATWIRSWLDERGVPALWSPEERRDHPVTDRPTIRFCREPEFASRCIERWQAFATACESATVLPVQIFDACFFQNTVRFLLEHEHAEGEPARYLKETEQAIERLAPRLVYLTQRDPRTFLEAQMVDRKGREIVEKIAAYTETTAYAKRRSLTGVSGMIEFYVAYRAACDALLAESRIPRIELDSCALAPQEMQRRVEIALADWFEPAPELPPEP